MIGQKIGSYLIESELGAGAMGVVYKGVHIEKNRPAAIKTVHKEALARGGKALDRFFREIDLLEQFRHPNIVRYMARGRYQGINYFVMEYIPGATLESIIKNQGPFDWKSVVTHAIQLCSALDYAHERSVIHRDLKPSNLMLNDQGQLKLTDFGIAKDLDATALTAPGRTLGTAAYMAPEQITGTPEVSHKTDLYALGAVLYEMLTGETPFKGETVPVLMHRHMTEPPPKPSDKTAVIPVALDQLIVRLMAKKPADRPWDAAAVGMELRKLLDKSGSGQKVDMVWPEEGSPDSMPTRAFMSPTSTSTPAAKAKGKSKKKGTREGSSADVPGLGGALQVAGLVAALIVVGGLIGYVVWPPSAGYLYAEAEKLMARPERTDWMIAQEHFLDPLDQRFPGHPFKKTTDDWRDRISLSHAEGRTEFIRTNAKSEVEELYLATLKAVKDAEERGDDREAARQWREMEKTLVSKPHPARGWGLLAGKRAEAVEREMGDRRAALGRMLEAADDFDRRELPDQANALRREAVAKYGKFSDLAELVAAAQAKMPKPTPEK